MPSERKQILAQDPAKTARAALRTYLSIAAAWGLNTEQTLALLGFDVRDCDAFSQWQQAPESVRLSRKNLDQLSCIFGIYQDLQILLPSPSAADTWIHRPNDAPLFGGRPALDRMLSGQVADLRAVRQYLAAQRAGK